MHLKATPVAGWSSKSTQWLIWWEVNQRNLWEMWRHKNTPKILQKLLQWVGAKLNGARRRELERLYNESHRAVARRYHPGDHDCLNLTGPLEW